MHGNPIALPPSSDPTARRIAALSDEYLGADPARKEEIGEEIAAMIDGKIVRLK